MFQSREHGDFGLPSEVVPIVSATGGAYRVLLGIAGDARGKVFYCNINTRPETPGWEHRETVTDTFSQWLDSLVDATRVPKEYREI